MRGRSVLRLGLRALLFVSAAFCLYYGVGILFFVPGYTGEAYWNAFRVYYGVAPVFIALLLFTIGYAMNTRR